MRSPHKPISKEALIASLEHRVFCPGGHKLVEEVRKRAFQSVTIIDAERNEDSPCGLKGLVSHQKVEEFDNYCGHALLQALIVLEIETKGIEFSSCVRLRNVGKLL